MNYEIEFKRALSYLKRFFDGNPKIRKWSYNDYRVSPFGDDSISFEVQFDTADKGWRENDTVLRDIIQRMERVPGIYCSESWGNDWEYYFTVHIDEMQW